MSVSGPRGCAGARQVTRITLGEYASAATFSGADGAVHTASPWLPHHRLHQHHHSSPIESVCVSACLDNNFRTLVNEIIAKVSAKCSQEGGVH